jgi:hypothetical protein
MWFVAIPRGRFKMRYQMSESSYIVVSFPTGHTVTIDIYKLSDSSKVVSAAAMTEIGNTGMYKYAQSLAPVAKTEYLYVATDSYDTRAGKIVLGGYPDTLATSQAAEEGYINTINGNVSTINSNIGTILSDIGTILSDIGAIESSQSGEEGNISSILSDIATILSNIGTIMGSQTDEEADIDNIESDISTMKGNVSTIQGDIDTIKSSQTSEEGDLDNIESDIATMQSEVSDIKSSQTTASSNISTIMGDESTIKSSQTDEESDIDTILARAPFAVGSTAYTDTVLDPSSNPLEGVSIEAYSGPDKNKTTIVDVQETNVNGIFLFYLNPGTYYLRAIKAGYTFTDWVKVIS